MPWLAHAMCAMHSCGYAQQGTRKSCGARKAPLYTPPPLPASRPKPHAPGPHEHSPQPAARTPCLQAQAAVPPPSLSDLKEYCLKLQSAVASEEARHEHELRVSHMFAAAAADSSKAARLRGMISASRGAQPALRHHPVEGSVGMPAAAVPAGAAGGGEGSESRGGASELWSGANEASARSALTSSTRAHADVLMLSSQGIGHSAGGGVGAAKRLAQARGAVERTLPLLLHPPPRTATGTGSKGRAPDRHGCEVPQGTARGEGEGSVATAQGQAPGAGAAQPHMPYPQANGNAAAHGRCHLQQAAPSVHGNAYNALATRASAQGERGGAVAGAPHQIGACHAAEHRLGGGRMRPSSAARLRALVANPPALPGADHRGGGTESGVMLQGSINSNEGGVIGHNSSGARPGASLAVELDTRVDSLKGGVAAILSKHGLIRASTRGPGQTKQLSQSTNGA